MKTRAGALLAATAIVFLAAFPAAFAYNDTGWSGMRGCGCHHRTWAGSSGPHGGYAAYTNACRSCHTTHDVGSLTADGLQAILSTAALNGYPAGDGRDPADNPRFQNSPHETQGYRMPVEAATSASGDDPCLNCHPPVALPQERPQGRAHGCVRVPRAA